MSEEKLKQLSFNREKNHGTWHDNAEVMMGLLDVMHAAKNWKTLGRPRQASLTMMAAKLARILTGNPDFLDHLDDFPNYFRIGFLRKTGYEPDPYNHESIGEENQ